MKIPITRDYKKILAVFVLYFTLFIGFFTFNFGLPNSILYICDVTTLLLLVVLSRKIISIIKKPSIFKILFPIILLLICGTISAVFHDLSILSWLWSIRNWGRLFAYFLIIIAVLKKDDCNRICNFVCKLWHINFFIVIVQAVFLSKFYTQDSLNGLFGRDVSGVHITMILVVVSIVTAKYITKEISFKFFILFMMEVIVIPVIAELRAIPIIVGMIIAAAYFMSFKLTVRIVVASLGYICLGIIGIFSLTYFMKILYPETALTYSLSGIINAASTKGGYGYSGGIDRLTFFSVINEQIFYHGYNWILGLGIGNAEYSAFSLLCSPFYKMHGGTLAYLRFSSAMLYIETGIVGLVLYFLSFFNMFAYFFHVVRNKICSHAFHKITFYEILGGEMALMCMFYIIYNNLQRTDASFIPAFFMAAAYIGTNASKEEKIHVK